MTASSAYVGPALMAAFSTSLVKAVEAQTIVLAVATIRERLQSQILALSISSPSDSTLNSA